MTRIAPGPQGSRAGLITALVIFVILFVTSTIFAIYYNTQWTAETHKHDQDIKSLGVVAKAGDLSNPEVQALVEGSRSRAPLDAVQLAIEQRNAVSKIVTGNASANTDAVTADAARAVKDVNDQLKAAGVAATIGSDNLLASLRTMTGQIVGLTQQVAKNQADLKATNEKVTQVTNERQALLGDKDKQIAAAQAEAETARKSLADREAGIGASTTAIQASATEAQTQSQKQAAAAAAEASKLTAQVKDLQKSIVAYTGKLTHYRINPTKALQQPDGVITRVPGNNTVFINLGEGQQISPGLTFEVYDKRKGLPPLTSPNGDETELPVGKASIEVIRVLPGTSECRIIKTATGQVIVEGDIIMNLVYNSHTRFNFVVYGDFDIANSGTPASGDADVIRRLVSQFGGRVNDQVTVDTDFVVLGKEPTVPKLPENPSALDTKRTEDAQKALDNYLDLRGKAITLGVPILNQNRFLYFVGYYDQAQR